MSGQAIVTARGRTLGSDRLVEADDALLELHRACGGAFPGTLAVPAALQLARRAWHHRVDLARTIHAHDGDSAIAAWLEVRPLGDGCELALSNVRAAPLAAREGETASAGEAALLSQVAELHARLDARQGVVAVGHAEPQLADLARQMDAAPARPWTEFVALPGATHRQPLHWRLLDGAAVEVDAVPGRWLARILPISGTGVAAGFDLFLLPESLAALPEGDAPVVGDPLPKALEGVLGRDLAPVLRLPVNRIIANAETIRTRLAGPLADEYANYAADIAEAGRHLLGLVEDLADLEAIEAPGFAPAPDHINLADAARRAAGILAVRAQDRGIVVIAPDVGLDVPAVGEWRRVLQILLNLIGNALRYAPERSTVRVSVAAQDGRAAAIVADEGPGIAPADQDKVFAKFERLGRSGDGGTGLGLYISRRLARAMGGDLRLESAPGEGARFTLELPAE